MERNWIFPAAPDEKALADFAEAAGVSPVLARMLWQRDHRDPDRARLFLDPRLKSLGDPFALPDMRPAVERIQAALERGEKIALYGDYDVDGVASLALLHRVLTSLGGQVGCMLPHRMDEGYGLSDDGVARCLQELSPRLLIAVDCGTSSSALIQRIEAGGVEVVVIDHHEVQNGEVPPCRAVVNPKRTGHLEYLCSGGLVFKVCHALLKLRGVKELDLRDYLDLVALATVSDLASLEGENRVLVRAGLERLARTRWPGVRALAEVAGVGPPYRAQDLAFKLGPRLNAAGRLDSAQAALDLLLTDDPAAARKLAQRLDTQNRERQAVEAAVLEEALAMVAAQGWAQAPAIVLGADGWHQGVLGIVAARLVRQFHRPAFVIGFDETGMGKGSGRSIDGFPLVNALEGCRPHLVQFGGHEKAAGLSISRECLEAFREALTALAQSGLTPELLQPRLHICTEVRLGELNLAFLEEHENLQPFGQRNPRPFLCARQVQLHHPPAIMGGKHLKMELAQGRDRRTAMFFNKSVEVLPPPPWDIAFAIEPNVWNGTRRLQLTIEDIRTAR